MFQQRFQAITLSMQGVQTSLRDITSHLKPPEVVYSPKCLDHSLVMNISGKLAQANGRLRSGRVGVTIEQNGRKLQLRATLPPKPSGKKKHPFQQRITLGLPANPAGLSEAEKEAPVVGVALASGEFTWEQYQGNRIRGEQKPCSEWVTEFEKHYLSSGGIEPTWRMDYFKIFKHLPQETLLQWKL